MRNMLLETRGKGTLLCSGRKPRSLFCSYVDNRFVSGELGFFSEEISKQRVEDVAKFLFLDYSEMWQLRWIEGTTVKQKGTRLDDLGNFQAIGILKDAKISFTVKKALERKPRVLDKCFVYFSRFLGNN